MVDPLLVTLLGMGVVFLVLLLLMVVISLFKVVFVAKSAPVAAPVATAAPVAKAEVASDEDEMVAAITAAVSLMMGGKAFNVLSITPSAPSGAWVSAGIVENTASL